MIGDYVALVAGGQSASSFSSLFEQTVSTSQPLAIFLRDPEPTAAPSPAAVPGAASDATFTAHAPLSAPNSSSGAAEPAILHRSEDVYGDFRFAMLTPNKAHSFDGPASSNIVVIAPETADLYWADDTHWRDEI